MRSQTTDMTNHQAQELTTLTSCWEIFLRDGRVLRLTSHDADLVIDGETYVAEAGFDRTAIAVGAELDVDTVEVNSFVSSAGISEEDIRMGRLNGARYRMFAVNWQLPDAGQTRLRSGRLGEVLLARSGRLRIELRSLADFLAQNAGDVFSPTCRADVGDSRCKFPILPPELGRDEAVTLGQFFRVPVAPGTTSEQFGNRIYEVTTAGTTASVIPTYDTTVGNTTADGTAVLRASEAWSRHGSVSSVSSSKVLTVSVSDPRNENGWFQDGLMTFESGPNAGITREIKTWSAAGVVELFLPFPALPETGNVFRISVGCAKIPDVCSTKFRINPSRDFANGNIFNYRGEFHLPGRDAVLSYPDTG